jgi:hypothetical protein
MFCQTTTKNQNQNRLFSLQLSDKHIYCTEHILCCNILQKSQQYYLKYGIYNMEQSAGKDQSTGYITSTAV